MKQDDIKSVKVWIVHESYDVDGIEGWLDEMARQGFRLVATHTFRAEFERVEGPSQTRYRLLPFDKAMGCRPGAETLETCARRGWEYVDTLKDSYYIFRADDAGAAELNPHAKQTAQGQLRRVLRISNRSLTAVPLLFFGFFVCWYVFWQDSILWMEDPARAFWHVMGVLAILLVGVIQNSVVFTIFGMTQNKQGLR